MIGGSLEVGPFEDGTNASLGQFDFGNWTIDYYNSLFYPFAKKTTTASSHTTGFYKSNFYTVDPNFTTAGGTEYLTGIIKNTLDAATREPKVEWLDIDGAKNEDVIRILTERCEKNLNAASKIQ